VPGLLEEVPAAAEGERVLRAARHARGASPAATRAEHSWHLEIRGFALWYSKVGTSNGQDTMQ